MRSLVVDIWHSIAARRANAGDMDGASRALDNADAIWQARRIEHRQRCPVPDCICEDCAD